jgi:hypothetical protein
MGYQPLWNMDGLSDSDVESVAKYVFTKAKARLPYLTGLELYESTGNGVTIGEQGFTSLPI